MSSKKAINYFDIKIFSYSIGGSVIMILMKKTPKNKLFGIPCFYAKGSHWSFARSSPEDGSLAIEVKEKLRISDNCSIGTYVFSSCEVFKYGRRIFKGCRYWQLRILQPQYIMLENLK